MQAYSSATDIIRACWIVFITIWLVAAVSTKRAVYRESRAQRLRYWVLFVIACLLLFYGRELPYPLNLRIIPHAIPIARAAAPLCAAGLAFALSGRVTTGRNWSGVAALKGGRELAQAGPHWSVR